MKVLYVISHEGVEERLERQFPDVEWAPFIPGMEQYQAFDAVLILEPFECLGKKEKELAPDRGGLYTSVFLLWKRFLAFHFPDVKLLIGGFARSDHANYLNLLDLSDKTDFAALVVAAEPVSKEWEDQIPQEGADILDKLKLFFEGHHKEGIIITMTKVRQGLNHAYYDYGLREVRLREFRKIWQEILAPLRNYVRLMQRRWENYAPFFENMPFYNQLAKVDIDGFLLELEKVIKGRRDLDDQELKKKQQQFIAFDGFNRLDELQQVLDLVNKRYINPEIIGTVLIIDDDQGFHNKLHHSFPIFKFDHAYSSKEGLASAAEKNYDLILLDLQLNPEVEELTGLDYIKTLKKLNPETPLIIVTTHGHRKVYMEAIELGADNFLVKNEFDLRQWGNLFIRTISGKLDTKIQPSPVREMPVLEQTEGKSQVLVVEDDDDWFEKIGAIQGKAIQFHLASTQQVALDLLRDANYDFDLVLLDLYLREKDRKEVLGGLKLIPIITNMKPLVPIIVISRDYTYAMTLEAINQGASDYLRKDQFNAQLWHNRFRNYIELKKNREVIEKMKNL